jgi:hypothetical protein
VKTPERLPCDFELGAIRSHKIFNIRLSFAFQKYVLVIHYSPACPKKWLELDQENSLEL